MVVQTKSNRSQSRLRSASRLGILLALTLCVAGCATSTRPTASVTQTSIGNAYRVQLPAGTTITLPDEVSENQIRAVAVNEIASEWRTPGAPLRLTAPLQLVSPAYMVERNDTEKRYALRIAELEEQLKAATTK